MFIFNKFRPSKKVHILNPRTDRTHCRIEGSHENAMANLDARAETAPPDRPVCMICADLAARTATWRQYPGKNYVMIGNSIVEKPNN